MLFSPTTIAQYIQFIYKNANLVNATLSNTCSTLINVFVYNYIFIVKKMVAIFCDHLNINIIQMLYLLCYFFFLPSSGSSCNSFT